jgi:hypothetical protein
MATRDAGWLPGTELLYSVPQALGFIAYEVAVELAQAELQVWIDVIVPLVEATVPGGSGQQVFRFHVRW